MTSLLDVFFQQSSQALFMERVREEGEEAEEEEARDWRDTPRPRGGHFARFGGLERQCQSGNWSNGMHLGLSFFLLNVSLQVSCVLSFQSLFWGWSGSRRRGRWSWERGGSKSGTLTSHVRQKSLALLVHCLIVYSSLIHLDRKKKRKKRRLLLHQMIKKKKRKSRGAALVKTGQEQQCVIFQSEMLSESLFQWEMLSIWCYAIINRQAKVQSGRKPCYGLKLRFIDAWVFDKCLLKFENLLYFSEWSLGRFMQLVLFCTALNQKWWLPWGSWIWRLDSIRRGTL